MPEWLWPKATAQASMLVRLGRLANWACYGLAAGGLALVFMALLFSPSGGDAKMFEVAVKFVAVALAGRGARYVLAGE